MISRKYDAIKEAFETIDKNALGYLDPIEFKDMLMNMGN